MSVLVNPINFNFLDCYYDGQAGIVLDCNSFQRFNVWVDSNSNKSSNISYDIKLVRSSSNEDVGKDEGRRDVGRGKATTRRDVFVTGRTIRTNRRSRYQGLLKY